MGFRFTVQGEAREIGLSGWVKNLGDGRVEILAEGQEADLKRLMSLIEQRFDGYISDKELHYEKAQGGYQGFLIH